MKEFEAFSPFARLPSSFDPKWLKQSSGSSGHPGLPEVKNVHLL
jgi:hypothetical protein